MNDRLQGKTLVALGDSLIYGNLIGNEATWVNKLGKKHGMTVYNHGINGNTMAWVATGNHKRPMCERYAEMENGADYVVVLGGANDHRLNVPIGSDTDRDPTTFKGALNLLISGLTEKYPNAKLLFLTNYRRKDTLNDLGLNEYAYVAAMEEVCALRGVPCFNNYRDCGISVLDPNQAPWADEGIVLDGNPNRHFSDEAYDRLVPVYEKLLEEL